MIKILPWTVRTSLRVVFWTLSRRPQLWTNRNTTLKLSSHKQQTPFHYHHSAVCVLCIYNRVSLYNIYIPYTRNKSALFSMYYHRIYTAPHILSYPSMRATLPLCWCNLTCIIQSQHPFAHTLYFQEKMMLLYPIGLVLHINVRQTQISFRNFVLLHPPFPKTKKTEKLDFPCAILLVAYTILLSMFVCVCVWERFICYLGYKARSEKIFPARGCVPPFHSQTTTTAPPSVCLMINATVKALLF